jgi:hypothetical protein
MGSLPNKDWGRDNLPPSSIGWSCSQLK